MLIKFLKGFSDTCGFTRNLRNSMINTHEQTFRTDLTIRGIYQILRAPGRCVVVYGRRTTRERSYRAREGALSRSRSRSQRPRRRAPCSRICVHTRETCSMTRRHRRGVVRDARKRGASCVNDASVRPSGVAAQSRAIHRFSLIFS